MLDVFQGFEGYSWLWNSDQRSQPGYTLGCCGLDEKQTVVPWMLRASESGDKDGRRSDSRVRGNRPEFDRPSQAYCAVRGGVSSLQRDDNALGLMRQVDCGQKSDF